MRRGSGLGGLLGLRQGLLAWTPPDHQRCYLRVILVADAREAPPIEPVVRRVITGGDQRTCNCPRRRMPALDGHGIAPLVMSRAPGTSEQRDA